jgi:hypothetical protein
MRNKYRFYQMLGLIAVLLNGVAYAFDQRLIDEANQKHKPKVTPKPKIPSKHHPKKPPKKIARRVNYFLG